MGLLTRLVHSGGFGASPYATLVGGGHRYSRAWRGKVWDWLAAQMGEANPAPCFAGAKLRLEGRMAVLGSRDAQGKAELPGEGGYGQVQREVGWWRWRDRCLDL